MNVEERSIIGTDCPEFPSNVRLFEDQSRQMHARLHVGQIIQNLIQAIEISRAEFCQHLPRVASDPFGKRHDMGFYDIHAGLAILAASRKIMLIQFMLMGVVNIVHNVWSYLG